MTGLRPWYRLIIRPFSPFVKPQSHPAKSAVNEFLKYIKSQRKRLYPSPAGEPTAAEMKKIWTVKKLRDGTLRLTAYKGDPANKDASVIVVPVAIGKSAVTELEGTFAMHRGPNLTWNTAEIILPDGLRAIGGSTFVSFHNLKELKIPESILRIGAFAFCSCKNLKFLRLPPALRSIGGDAFRGTGRACLRTVNN